VNTSNFEKFQTGNPIVRRLIGAFFDKVRSKVAAVPTRALLDAGCGEGMTLYQLGELIPERVAGFDINPDCVSYTKSIFQDASITKENIYELPYADNSFDLVLCLEVMEHLEHPDKALASLRRVANGRLLLSVPHEPWFRMGSLCRGKYLKSLGNHPEHINHWSPDSFERFLRKEFSNISIETSFPWIIAEVRLP